MLLDMSKVSNFLQVFRSRDLRFAWLVALAADAVQIAVLPLFVTGALTPADTIIDLTAALILWRLLGWHWAFLPTLFAELLPGLDLFPTWTAAVLYVTVQRARSTQQEVEVEVLTPHRFLNS
jgi:hypothetical protein